MKLSDLLDRIKSRPEVLRLEPIEKHPPYHFYRIRVKEAEDLVREFAVCIVVENEGTDKEAAYFKDRRPFTERAETDLDKARSKIIERCGFIRAESFTVNRAEKYAVITGFIDNGDGTASRKTYLAYIDGGKLKLLELR